MIFFHLLAFTFLAFFVPSSRHRVFRKKGGDTLHSLDLPRWLHIFEIKLKHSPQYMWFKWTRLQTLKFSEPMRFHFLALQRSELRWQEDVSPEHQEALPDRTQRRPSSVPSLFIVSLEHSSAPLLLSFEALCKAPACGCNIRHPEIFFWGKILITKANKWCLLWPAGISYSFLPAPVFIFLPFQCDLCLWCIRGHMEKVQ